MDSALLLARLLRLAFLRRIVAAAQIEMQIRAEDGSESKRRALSVEVN